MIVPSPPDIAMSAMPWERDFSSVVSAMYAVAAGLIPPTISPYASRSASSSANSGTPLTQPHRPACTPSARAA